MRRTLSILFLLLSVTAGVYCQVEKAPDMKILFRGVVKDASTALPLSNTQIFVNRDFITSTDSAGTFSFRISRNDSVLFTNLGYRPSLYRVNENLMASEIMAGVYLTSDTISIGEVIIIPKRPNFRSEILNAPLPSTPERQNAKNNLEVASYQGRVSTGNLGDPASNYSLVRQQLSREAREKGQVSSDQMVGFSPLVVIPMVYMLLKGPPGKPEPLKPNLTREELNQIHKAYLDSLRVRR